MTDDRAAQILAQMRGNGAQYETRNLDEMPDSTSVRLMRGLRGRTDYSSVHEANAKGQQQHERDVRTRARALANQGIPHPEATAREQIRREAQQSAETERRHQVFEAMSQSDEQDRERAKWEQRANRPLRADGLREPGEPYVMPGRSGSARRDRTAERLMAQYWGGAQAE
ncbi:hypothetical protein C4J65_10470 [Streptomyces sp. CB09001]|uniref:hypothetical protein n=1 Tax=Streptomyces sp. CB09001 TaxID=2083284 RepID=UPI000E211289|nr:hypothetical protein [Streptomyces sp. CB09001]AXL88703.1 hypothetical protein C4J65_10470 [Streptomyces sp. CB09001]